MLVRPSPRRRFLSTRQIEALQGYLYAGPWILGFFIFTAGPMIGSIYLSLTEYALFDAPRWVGLSNYRKLFMIDDLFRQALKVTATYVFLGVPLRMAGALGLALILNQNLGGMGLYRTGYYSPAIVSGVAVAILWKWLLSPDFGLVNGVLWSLFRIEGPGWFTSPEWALPGLIVMSLWGVGGGMVIFLAGLQGIPTRLYEAASIDGANWWRRFRHVTIPMLTPVIFFSLVMGVIGSFQTFTTAFIITGGGPMNATLFYVLYLYRSAFQFFEMGYASALAWILFAILIGLTILQVSLANRWVYYEGAETA